jgi:7,8-dihydro-6-hydroxymethylpterin-pyrophosphokinase
MLWHPAYVGIGSNLDEPASQVRRRSRLALGCRRRGWY